MGSEYKAVPYKKIVHHEIPVDLKDSLGNSTGYDTSETRFRIVSTETGEVLDDAQGYGYKTAQKAYAAYAYKTRDKSKDKEKLEKKRHIEQWMKEHRSFVSLMNRTAFDIQKGSQAPEDKFDAKYLKKMLDECELKPDFTAYELLRVWRNQ